MRSAGSTVASTGVLATITKRLSAALRKRWRSIRAARWRIGVSATPPDRTTTTPGNCRTPPVRPRRSRAHDSARAALAVSDRVTAPERALIEALPARYPQRDPIDDQRPWNDAFADAMRLAHRAHPDDLDLRHIFAEAILNRTPWRMWDLRTGEPAPGAGTLEAREVLESAFHHLPGAMNHPGLLHLYVHLMEMSPHPEAALVTGDRLRELTPDMGHLVHMPTHIDVQCGHYRDAMHWNQKAIIADRKFYDRAGPMNFYSGYRVHITTSPPTAPCSSASTRPRSPLLTS